MSAATIPFTPAPPSSAPWSPTDRDRLIFQWVKFDGQTQAWVADQLEISQSTVSRVIERYERWIARGGPAQQGALTYDERLRTQRWLTYERNERILASALRIASEMEQALEASKSTIRRPMGNPSAETQVFTEHRMIDRSGLAARYLRLAYRINMDQLKLVERDPLPPLPWEESQGENSDLPLPLGEGQGEGMDALNNEDFADNPFPSNQQEPALKQFHTEPRNSQSSDLPDDDSLSDFPLRASAPPRENLPPAPKTENRKPQTVSIIELSPNTQPMHTLHNPDDAKPSLTNIPSTTSSKSSPSKNPPDHAYAVATDPPKLTTAEALPASRLLPTTHHLTTSHPLAPSH